MVYHKPDGDVTPGGDGTPREIRFVGPSGTDKLGKSVIDYPGFYSSNQLLGKFNQGLI